MDPAQIEANITLEQALRRANLLAAAAEVSQNITHILDIDLLLPTTVDIICEAYDFYYAGVFLIDAAGEFAVLRAGRGEPGRIMMENNHKLAVGGNSMIGACTALNEARISLDVDTERVWYPNPVLPETRSEMALPLAIGERVIGAVTVQSVEAAAFSDEDVTSLQAMASQLAIAIENARQRSELEEAHAALLRAKTFEAIATATGDAIHWIGNKAEPIGGTVERIRHDLQVMVCMLAELIAQQGADSPDLANQPLAQLLAKETAPIRQHSPEIMETVNRFNRLSLDKLEKQLSLASVLEDLQIIEEAGSLILQVKEDLIGPAREQAPRPVMIDDVVRDAVSQMDLPPGVVTINIPERLPLVQADPVQLNRVFTNLFKNGYEAAADRAKPQINVTIRPDHSKTFVLVDVTDNGVGIPEEELDKIWITFHTTKGRRGHTGLGLPACRLILEQIGGHISVTSQPGQGATFTLSVPVMGPRKEVQNQAGRGKVLLIDDNDSWCQFALASLEPAGYKTTLSGEDYLTDPYQPYDLIIVDDILTGTDSLTIFQSLKAAGVISKVLAVSSNPRVERTKERMLLGIHNLIPKPYTRAAFLSTVKSTLKALHPTERSH